MKRVFVLSDGSLLGEGVRMLIGREADLDVVGCETDVDRAIERIREIQPDIVILDQDAWPGEPGPKMMSLQEKGAGIKFVGLSLQGNTVRCYWRETRMVERVEDLMKAIK